VRRRVPPPRANVRIVTSGAGVMFTTVHESRRRQQPRRPYVPRHQRDGFRADRSAALAVALAILLVFVAAASAHAATLHAVVGLH
jgi:hypothetical protein